MQELNELKINLIQKIATLDADELHLLLEKANTITNERITAKMGIVEFTEKELNTMPKNIKRLLVIDKKRCRLRTKTSGKDTVTYEIRFRRDGYNISACGKTIELAKANFLSKCKTVTLDNDAGTNNTFKNFDDFSQYYFKMFREEKVSAQTLRADLSRYKNYLYPHPVSQFGIPRSNH